MSNPSEDAVEKAKRLDMDLIEPRPDELFVDLDTMQSIADFADRFDSFTQVYPLATVQYTTSKSGNLHAYVTVPELAPLKTKERIAMQAALGSDPLREMIALKHHRDGYIYASVFFEKKGTVRRDLVAGLTAVEGGAR